MFNVDSEMGCVKVSLSVDNIKVVMYNIKVLIALNMNIIHISGCGAVWGRFRAPPVADEARNKEWQ